MATTTTSEQRTSVRGLGEIALRVNNLDAMQQFYERVIGLPLMTRFLNSAFQDRGRLRPSHASTGLVRPLRESRLSRDGRCNFDHLPHRIRDTS